METYRLCVCILPGPSEYFFELFGDDFGMGLVMGVVIYLALILAGFMVSGLLVTVGLV
jgi:hypothetical protein